jgi:HD-GYP domain-containing protein (c-di-GMP phosphodiesterase class II)
VRDANGKLLLACGFVLHDEAQVASLLSRGVYVDAEEFRAVEAARHPAALTNMPTRPPNLFDHWGGASARLQHLLKHIGNEPAFVESLDTLAGEVVTLVEHDPDISIFLAVRQDPSRLPMYGYNHAMHCAVIGMLTARRLDWPAEQVLLLVKAALTMNVSIAEMQGKLAGQDVPVTRSQLDAIRSHTTDAVKLLNQAGVTDPQWLEAVGQHHERADGSGYPAGITTPSMLALALRHADVLMAKISPRTLRAPLPIQEAMRQLFREDKGGAMSTAIIKEFGIYPPGDYVQLKSGERAVVVRRTEVASKPIVAAITDHLAKPVTSSIRRDTAQPEFAITGTVADKSPVMRMAPERLYGLPI